MGSKRYAEILLSEMDDFERQFNRFWMSAAGLNALYFACWFYYFNAVVWFWLLLIEFNHTRLSRRLSVNVAASLSGLCIGENI